MYRVCLHFILTPAHESVAFQCLHFACVHTLCVYLDRMVAEHTFKSTVKCEHIWVCLSKFSGADGAAVAAIACHYEFQMNDVHDIFSIQKTHHDIPC